MLCIFCVITIKTRQVCMPYIFICWIWHVHVMFFCSDVISFLTKWVQEPDEDDWGKLKHVLKYLKGILYMKLVLSADSLNSMEWWRDASYGAHWYMQDHTGMMMSLGREAFMSASSGKNQHSEFHGVQASRHWKYDPQYDERDLFFWITGVYSRT